MLVELFIFFEIIVIGLFLASFFTKQELLWGLTVVISGFLVISSFSIEKNIYEWNTSITAYQPITHSYYYPYLMGINLGFLVLSIILMIYDLFDKYSSLITDDVPDEELVSNIRRM